MPQVTVIVPVYKTEQYLPACVEGILAQSFSDFELLLVDDGSPDGSGVLCDAYAAKDTRVKAIHKPNGGVSSARNCGLDAAKGEYVVFVDSDDCVRENYLSGLLAAQQRCGSEKTLVITEYQSFDGNVFLKKPVPEGFTLDLDDPGSDAAERFRALVFGFRIFPPYCKLYSRAVLEHAGLRFNTEIRTAEDFDFNVRYLAQMELVCFVPEADYCYREGYKQYRPSNGGVLGDSEIKSAHIMAHGITDLAKRMGVYEEVYDDICRWAAKKHYFNRLPMLFAENDAVSTAERRSLYRALTADPVYRNAYRDGVSGMQRSTTRRIGMYCDCFAVWRAFWNVNHSRIKRT